MAALHGGKIEIHIDKINGPLMGLVNVNKSGEGDVWTTIQAPVKSQTGTHDLYFVFRGDKDLFYFDWWKLNKR